MTLSISAPRATAASQRRSPRNAASTQSSRTPQCMTIRVTFSKPPTHRTVLKPCIRNAPTKLQLEKVSRERYSCLPNELSKLLRRRLLRLQGRLLRDVYRLAGETTGWADLFIRYSPPSSLPSVSLPYYLILRSFNSIFYLQISFIPIFQEILIHLRVFKRDAQIHLNKQPFIPINLNLL